MPKTDPPRLVVRQDPGAANGADAEPLTPAHGIVGADYVKAKLAQAEAKRKPKRRATLAAGILSALGALGAGGYGLKNGQDAKESVGTVQARFDERLKAETDKLNDQKTRLDHQERATRRLERKVDRQSLQLEAIGEKLGARKVPKQPEEDEP